MGSVSFHGMTQDGISNVIVDAVRALRDRIDDQAKTIHNMRETSHARFEEVQRLFKECQRLNAIIRSSSPSCAAVQERDERIKRLKEDNAELEKRKDELTAQCRALDVKNALLHEEVASFRRIEEVLHARLANQSNIISRLSNGEAVFSIRNGIQEVVTRESIPQDIKDEAQEFLGAMVERLTPKTVALLQRIAKG